jgi:hypothetical protein
MVQAGRKLPSSLYSTRGRFFFAGNICRLLAGMGIILHINENYIARWLA